MEELGTYISLFRKFKDWEWYKDVPTKVVFIHCLIKANFKALKYKGRVIERGQFVTSLDTLSKETGLSKQQVRTALKKLNSTQELTQSTTQRETTICVVNYDKYQMFRDVNNTDVNTNDNIVTTSYQHHSNILSTTSNKDNNNNKGNKDNKKEYGTLKNVLLTDDEYLKIVESNLLSYIDDLSLYIPNKKGKPYVNHYATILQWSRKDEKEKSRNNKELPAWYQNQSNIDTGVEDFDESELQEKIKRLRGEDTIDDNVR